MSKFDELKKRAEAATPGPWEATRQTDDECSFIGYFIEGVGKTISDDGTAPDHHDALFIAAANPAAILELLAVQAQLVEALANIAQPANAGCGCHFPCRCDSEGAEAINAVSMRSEAQEALVAYYAAADAVLHNQQQGE